MALKHPVRQTVQFGLIFAPRFSSSANGQRRWRAADVSVGTRNLRREFSKSLKAQRASFNYSGAKVHSRSLSIVPSKKAVARVRKTE